MEKTVTFHERKSYLQNPNCYFLEPNTGGIRNWTGTVYLFSEDSSKTITKRKKKRAGGGKQVKLSLLSKNASCDNATKGKLLLPLWEQQNSNFSLRTMFNFCLELTPLHFREMTSCRGQNNPPECWSTSAKEDWKKKQTKPETQQNKTENLHHLSKTQKIKKTLFRTKCYRWAFYNVLKHFQNVSYWHT